MVAGITGLVGRLLEGPLDVIVWGLARLGIRPNALTLTGLFLNMVAAATLYMGRFRWAAALILVANLLDVFDGHLARRTGQVSPFGAFLDSVVDRYADLALMSALWLYYSRSHDHGMLFVIGLAIMGSVMTSYTRARAECLIPSCKVGIFERLERIAVLVLGAFLDRMPQALLIIAVFANLTGIHRIVYTWRVLSAPVEPPKSDRVDGMNGGRSDTAMREGGSKAMRHYGQQFMDLWTFVLSKFVEAWSKRSVTHDKRGGVTSDE